MNKMVTKPFPYYTLSLNESSSRSAEEILCFIKKMSLCFSFLPVSRLIMPCVQLVLINMHRDQTVLGSILNILISPLFISIGKSCGRIDIHQEKDEDK